MSLGSLEISHLYAIDNHSSGCHNHSRSTDYDDTADTCTPFHLYVAYVQFDIMKLVGGTNFVLTTDNNHNSD